MRFNSIRFKISVLYVAILGVILIIYSSVLYLSLHYTLYGELDYELITKAEEIKNIINDYLDLVGHEQESFLFVLKKVIQLEGEHPDQDKMDEFEKQWLLKVDRYDLKEDFINFLDIDGKSIVHSPNLTEKLLYAFEKDTKKIMHKDVQFRDVTMKKNRIRLVTITFSHENLPKYMLQVGTSLKPIIHILNNRLFYIAISIPVILLFAAFLGQIFTAGILKPVVEITRTARNITHENLSARVKAEHIDVEMRYLVDAFNDMIMRLEESFKYIMEFSSHVAHELKTPLAIIVGESELLQRKNQGVEEYKGVIDIILEESGRMLKTINDLLLLAKLDFRPDVFKLEDIHFTDFLDEIHKQSEILALRKRIKVTIQMPDEPIYVHGDRLHLRRLFFNLLDNAIKFTPQGGRIGLIIRSQDKKVVVTVSDTGIGISEEDLPEIFNRFFRGEKKGTDDESGSGLGLSISLSIAKIHNGEILVKSEPGKGTTFHVILPLISLSSQPNRFFL